MKVSYLQELSSPVRTWRSDVSRRTPTPRPTHTKRRTHCNAEAVQTWDFVGLWAYWSRFSSSSVSSVW